MTGSTFTAMASARTNSTEPKSLGGSMIALLLLAAATARPHAAAAPDTSTRTGLVASYTAMLKRVDSDGDGRVSRMEWAAMVDASPMLQSEGLSEAQRNGLRAALMAGFDQKDSDKDGSLTLDELMAKWNLQAEPYKESARMLLDIHNPKRSRTTVGIGPFDRLAGLQSDQARAHLRMDGDRAALDVGIGGKDDLDAPTHARGFIDKGDGRTQGRDIARKLVAGGNVRPIDLVEQHSGDFRSARFQSHRVACDQGIIGFGNVDRRLRRCGIYILVHGESHECGLKWDALGAPERRGKGTSVALVGNPQTHERNALGVWG